MSTFLSSPIKVKKKKANFWNIQWKKSLASRIKSKVKNEFQPQHAVIYLLCDDITRLNENVFFVLISPSECQPLKLVYRCSLWTLVQTDFVWARLSARDLHQWTCEFSPSCYLMLCSFVSHWITFCTTKIWIKDLRKKAISEKKIRLNLKNGWTEVENYDFTLSEIVLNKKHLFNWFHLLLEFSQEEWIFSNFYQLLND